MWPMRSELKLSFTFISRWGRREILQCETAGRTVQPNFSPSLENEQYGDSAHTLQTMEEGGWKGGGLIFSSFPCLSSHLHDPAPLNLPSQVRENTGRKKTQTKVVKGRRGETAQGRHRGNNWRVSDKIRGGWEWREREKMQTHLRWPALWDAAARCHFKNDCNKSDRRKMDLVILAC